MEMKKEREKTKNDLLRKKGRKTRKETDWQQQERFFRGKKVIKSDKSSVNFPVNINGLFFFLSWETDNESVLLKKRN